MLFITKLIEYVAMIVILYRTGGDMICMACGLLLVYAAFWEGALVNEEEGKGGGSED